MHTITMPASGPYAAVAALLATPLPIPPGAPPRAALAAEIERLITILDLLDGDPDFEETGDLEPYLAGAPSYPLDAELDESELEHSLGSLDRAMDQRRWSECNAYTGNGDLELDRADLEPSLGSLEMVDQRLWSRSDRRDREVDDADDEMDTGNPLGARIDPSCRFIIEERVGDRQVRP